MGGTMGARSNYDLRSSWKTPDRQGGMQVYYHSSAYLRTWSRGRKGGGLKEGLGRKCSLGENLASEAYRAEFNA